MAYRPLTYSDYEQYVSVINEFRKTEFTAQQFNDVLDYVKKTGDIWIYVEEGKILATGTIFFERKLIFNTCTLAHIEDVCVISEKRGLGLGKKMVKYLFEQAKARGCYKVTLDCNDHNVGFYESCGLGKRGNQMCELISNL
jgi:glucosamine-phosphate N-acetyltransferase